MRFLCMLGLIYAACGDSGAPLDAGLDLSGAADLAPDQAVAGPGSCTPFLPPGFAPSYVPPSGAHQGKCTSQQIDDAIVALPGFDDMGGSTFADWMGANASCAACLVTKDFAGATWGPWLTNSATKTIGVNQWGCVELTGGKSDCVAEGEALQECNIDACAPWCMVDPMDSQTLRDFNLCLANASHTACNVYLQKLQLCEVDLDGDAGDLPACLHLPSNFTDYLRQVANLFCGP